MADSKNEDNSSSGIILLAKANSHLAVHLHRLLAEDKGNVFFCPFGISTAMTMLMCGARGNTESELKCALGHEYAGFENPSVAFRDQISTILEGSDEYTFCCGNAMMISSDFKVEDQYKSLLSEAFDANLMEVDFVRESKQVMSDVNDWVKKKTNGMIPSLLDSLDPTTVFILLNAVYFKGTWLHKFNVDDTVLQKFYNKGLRDHFREINMMHQKEVFLYAEEETHQLLELPYAGNDLAMVILLPNELDGLSNLESSLGPLFIQDTRELLRKKIVKVSLPRFRMEYSKTLNTCFQKLGVSLAFSSEAELSAISECEKLNVSEILHKAVLEVNEEGSEAAAATVIRMQRSLKPRVPEFVVDHPFLVVIYDKRNDLILFMGRVEEL